MASSQSRPRPLFVFLWGRHPEMSTGGLTGKRDRAEGDFWLCAIFLSLHGRIDPETRKSGTDGDDVEVSYNHV